jgi:hypothetical protein
MAWIMFSISCIIVSFLVVKFSKVLTALFGILVAIAVLGIVVMPINLDLGIKMTMYSIVYMIVGFIIFAVSGVVSTFVVAPLVVLWASLKSLFIK